MLLDGPPAEVLDLGLGAALSEIWTVAAGPLDRHSPDDRGKGPVRLGPPTGGVKIRWFTLAPAGSQSVAETEKWFSEAFASMDGNDHRPDTSRHPGMHLTLTLDVIILVRGSVRLLLDNDERVLGPGDVVVQRGTNHAWVCEGEEPALLVAVLVDKGFANQ